MSVRDRDTYKANLSKIGQAVKKGGEHVAHLKQVYLMNLGMCTVSPRRAMKTCSCKGKFPVSSMHAVLCKRAPQSREMYCAIAGTGGPEIKFLQQPGTQTNACHFPEVL